MFAIRFAVLRINAYDNALRKIQSPHLFLTYLTNKYHLLGFVWNEKVTS